MNRETENVEWGTKEHELVKKYMNGNKMHRMYLDREVLKTGVYRSQHQILMYIARFPNASQKEIANHQQVSTATIAVSLKKLEKGGYISRVVDCNDNRYNQICITEKGQAVVEESVQIFRKAEEGMFRGFTPEEKEKLGDFLDRMYLNMEYLLQE